MRYRLGLLRGALAGLFLALPVAAANANLVAYDPFLIGDARGDGEYTTDTDMRTMGAAALGWAGTDGLDGFGISHAGTTGNFQADDDFTLNSGAVDYEQGGRMRWLGVGPGSFDRNLTRQLSTVAAGTASNTWWFSIMVNRLGWLDPPAAADNTFVVGGFTDASGNGLQVGYSDEAGDGVPDLVLRTNNTNNVLVADTAPSGTQFVIVELTINDAGADDISVWLNPASVADLDLAGDVEISSENISDSLSPFTQSKYESPGQSGQVFFDEIRLGTTRDAVVPAPLLVGDYNGDTRIDAADYTVWRDSVGTGATIGSHAAWKENFGAGVPSNSSSPSSATPEPASWVGLVGLLALRRRRR